MREELEETLFRDYPKLYERGLDYGFECGDGWYHLIRRLSAKLTALRVVTAGQVKEKFGGLRFYIDPIMDCTDAQWDAINAVIQEVEEESVSTCQWCGSSAGRGAICDLCYVARLQTSWRDR